MSEHYEMLEDCERIILTRAQIEEKLEETAKQMAKDYEGKNPLMVCILRGAVFVYAELLSRMDIPVAMDFMRVSSYGNSTTSAQVCIVSDLSVECTGRDIVIVEDIIDSGRTIYALKELFYKRGAKSVKAFTLLDKPSRRAFPLEPDYVCFEVEDEFVVGWGMDYAEHYRNLPYVAVLKRSVYE